MTVDVDPDSRLRVRYLTGRVGAELYGVDLANLAEHYAIADDGDQRRRMHRVTRAGIPAVGLDGRPSRSLQGDASRYDSDG